MLASLAGRWSILACALSALGALGCGAHDGEQGGDPLRQATASAMLGSIGGGAISATATFVATETGVDLELRMRGCEGTAPKPLRIVDTHDCGAVTSSSAAWGDARGEGIPGVRCTSPSSGEGVLRYSRRNMLETRWTVGDGSQRDVVGRALVLLDPVTLAPTACGVIEPGPDRMLVAAPAENEPPGIETRGRLAGSCLTELMAGAASGACSDKAALSACATEHCELGACLAECTGFTACLESSSDACGAFLTCELSEACASCQIALQPCAYGFCAEHLACPAIPRPGGPCSQMMACCTLQGERANECIDVANLIGAHGGEPSCINGLSDWDIISHMHVPCDTKAAFEAALAHVPDGAPLGALDGEPCMTAADCAADELCAGAGNAALLSLPGRCLARAATRPLGDDIAGRACTADTECGGGRCAASTPLLTPFPEGYCTGACYDDATCGLGGACVLPRGSTEPGVCYRSCATDADCARESYRCTPLGDGTNVISVCYPRRDPLPDHSIGGPCTTDGDCTANVSCLREMSFSFSDEVVAAPGGYCSVPCMYDADCGAGAQCISSGIAGGRCMASCADAAPCREGYRCVPHLRDGDPEQQVCMPIWD